ncbi:MAG: Mur ligase family protein [Lautropia sp.]
MTTASEHPMPLSDLAGRRVGVVGLGVSGLAMARWLAREGADVVVLDSRESPPGAVALREHCPQATLLHAPFELQAFGEPPAAIAWSPGVSPLVGDARRLHEQARTASVPVLGELDLFSQALQRLHATGYAPRVLAVTGTNGKTTVTELLAHLAREAGLDAQAAGNIGPALLDALRDRLDAQRLPQLWALELSSFQLALAEPPACTVAAILNVTQDHFDWHGDMTAYREAKLRIHRRAATRVVNVDDPATDPDVRFDADGRGIDPAAALAQALRAAEAPGAKVSKAAIARAEKAARDAAAGKVGFGLGAPATVPGYGVVREGGLAWLVEATADGEPGARRTRGDAPERHVRRLMPADALRVRGSHNHANVLAALAMLRAADVPMAPLLRGLRDFEAGAHRCRLVTVINDVEYIDDSKATNVGATVAALAGLSKRCVLIAGGLGKGQDFAPLATAVRRHAKAVMLIGRDAPVLRAALRDTGVELVDCDSMPAAVNEAARRAGTGESVLLSPACASLDMFRNYPHRAEVFAAAVRELADALGQPC